MEEGSSGSNPTTTSNPAPAPAEYTVEVDGGYGSGSHRPGDTVHVWSAASPADRVVDAWTGDASLLAAPGEWRTSFVMPERDVRLRANSRPAAVTLIEETWRGATEVSKEVRYAVPATPRGVVLVSHGTGGSSSFIEGVEPFALTLALLDAGYGVVSAEAEEVVAGDLDGDGKIRWSTRSIRSNVDLRNVDMLFGDLEARGILPDGLPKFALGMSNGGSFSHFLGSVSATPFAEQFPELRFGAVVSFCADASSVHRRTPTTTPSAWFMCGAEDNAEVSNDQARTTEAALRGRGVPTEYAENPPSPLYPERFTRVAGISPATSRDMTEELYRGGVVDPATGMVTLDADEIAARVAADPATYPVLSAQDAALREVRTQLKVTRAEHSMFSDFTRRTLDLLERHDE